MNNLNQVAVAKDAGNVTSIYRGDPELREEVRAVMHADKRLSQSILAKEAGISGAAFNQWLNGVYAGNNEAVDGKMRIWLESHRARVAADDALPEAPTYVDTPTASRVISALSYAQVAGDIAITYGAAGLGKTTACRQYQRSRPNVWIVTMKPSCAGVVTCLSRIAAELGLSVTGGALVMSVAIARRVRDTHGLLVIDEAQHLSVAALDEVRSIHDEVGIGIALVGNEGVWARMAGGRNSTQLDRLFSRIGKRLALRKSSDADIQALVKAWGITDKKCMAVMLQIARGPGALRALTKTLRLASMQAAAEKRSICCEDVRGAARELGTAA